jgi:hypothetical protein
VERREHLCDGFVRARLLSLPRAIIGTSPFGILGGHGHGGIIRSSICGIVLADQLTFRDFSACIAKIHSGL